MGIASLDPSMLVGFMIRDEADWEDFVERVSEVSPFFFRFSCGGVLLMWMRNRWLEIINQFSRLPTSLLHGCCRDLRPPQL